MNGSRILINQDQNGCFKTTITVSYHGEISSSGLIKPDPIGTSYRVNRFWNIISSAVVAEA